MEQNKQDEILRVVEVVDGHARFSKIEFETIPEFKALWSRLKKCKGDADGRRKHLNSKELMYAKYIADGSGIHAGLSGEKLYKKAKQDAGLPNNWKPDKVVEEAISKIIEIQNDYSPTTELLRACKQGMMLSAEVVRDQIEQMRTAKDAATRLKVQLKEAGELEEVQALTKSLDETSTLVQARIKDFMKLITEIPKIRKQLNSLIEEVKLEKSGKQIKRGGHEKGRREDPK